MTDQVSPDTAQPDAVPAAEAPPLPGFDPDLYLALNPDVAAQEGLDPATHYRDHGRAELRALLPEGHGLDHPDSRALDPAERSDWQSVLRARTQDTPLSELIAAHPRAAWLQTGFTLGGYLRQCPDVAAAVDDPLEAAFHFLEFGLEEGRLGHPQSWEADFVAARYGIVADARHDSPLQVLARVLAQGVSPLEAALTEAQMWEAAGLYGPEMARLFDHEYYHAICHRDAPQDAPDSHDRAFCIAHFLQHGIAALRPIHPDEVFDPEFYAQQLDAAQTDALLPADPVTRERPAPGAADVAPALYRHWLRRGLRSGLAPNLQSWGQRHAGLKVPQALYAQMPVFGLAARLPADSLMLDKLRHFLAHPRPAAAALDLSDPEVANLTVTLADQAAMRGEDDTAEWLYWLILSTRPDHQRARRHLADLEQRKNRLEMARSLRGGLDPEQGGGWNVLSLAEMQLQQQQYENACATLAGLPRKFLADVAIARKHRSLSEEIFRRIWDNLGPHVAAYGIARTQDQLRAALRLRTPEFTTADRSRPVRRVALVGNEDLYQCKLYRVDQKAEQLRAAGLEVTVISPSRELDDFIAHIDAYDAAIFFRVPAFPPMIDAIAAAAQHGLLTFYEIDDIVFDTDHFPPSLDSYAGQISAADYAAMACGVPLFEHAMGLCDYGIASTATIARLMEGKVRKGVVLEHHNALGRLHMAALDAAPRAAPMPTDGAAPLTLLYASGTKAHKEDFHDILEPALAEILRRYPGRVRVRLVGYFGTFTHLDPDSDAVEIREPVWDFEAYCAMVARADINLSVLSRSLLTDAKSEIKWMEAAMFGIPSVVSDTATHREVIEDGKTGFLAADTEGFVAALDRLVADDALRARMGQAARDRVMRDYAIERMGQTLREGIDRLRPPGPRKTRVMVVNVFYPPQAIGGATRVVHDNVALLHAHYGDRYEIDVVCTLDGGDTPLSVTSYAQDGVRVWAITAPAQPQGDMTPRDPHMAELFEQLVERLSPDLIHFHCIQRLTASVVNVARLRKIPYLITLHDGWWISPNQFVIDEHDRAEYYDYRDPDAPDFPDRAQALARPLQGAARLLAVSESFAQLHRDCGLERIEVTENGVSPLPPCTRSPSPGGRVRLAHIGGASRHKGIHLVQNALLANPYENLELLLIDHALAPGTEIHEVWGTTPVTRAAKVPQSEIAALYGRIDILLAPSIWPESYGLVTREAMACGAWVIASDRGAIGADIVEGVTGHRVDVATYDGLAQVLWQVDRDPGRYLGPPGQPPAARRVRDQVDQLAEIYDQVLTERRGG